MTRHGIIKSKHNKLGKKAAIAGNTASTRKIIIIIIGEKI